MTCNSSFTYLVRWTSQQIAPNIAGESKIEDVEMLVGKMSDLQSKGQTVRGSLGGRITDGKTPAQYFFSLANLVKMIGA